MNVTKGPFGSALPQGKTFPVLKNSSIIAGEDTRKFGVDSDGILIWVDVKQVTGTIVISVDTIGETDSDYKACFPAIIISSPTAEPVIRTAVNILSTVRVTVTYTGSCEYNIRARGIGRGGAGADDVQLLVDLDPLLVSSPQIQNINLTTAGAEQAVVLPIGVKRFKFQAVNDALLQYAYESNASYMTVWPGNSEEEYNIDDNVSLTLYLKTNKDNTPFQLLVWI